MGNHHSHHGHSHGHDQHGHSHAHPQPSSHFAFAIAVVLNLGYTIAQAIYALMANSMSLLADAGHNLGDVLGLLLAWGATWLLTLPARKRYSYGFKRTTILAALSNAVILVATAALIAYESIYKLFHLSAIDSKVVIIVAIVGIIINGGTALLFLKGAEDDLNIKGALYHLLSDALISFGVVIAAGLIMLTGKVWIDPIVGLIIVLIILQGTRGLLRDSVTLLLDAIPHYIDHAGVKHYLTNLPGVIAVHDLHIWGLSTREVALTAHLVSPEGTLTDADYQKINSHLRNQFKIQHATIQVESGSLDHPCEQTDSC